MRLTIAAAALLLLFPATDSHAQGAAERYLVCHVEDRGTDIAYLTPVIAYRSALRAQPALVPMPALMSDEIFWREVGGQTASTLGQELKSHVEARHRNGRPLNRGMFNVTCYIFAARAEADANRRSTASRLQQQAAPGGGTWQVRELGWKPPATVTSGTAQPQPSQRSAVAQPAQQPVTLRVCIVRNGQIETVEAAYNPATGDTTVNGRPFSQVYSPTTGYAHSRPWYEQNQPLDVGDGFYVKYGLPRVLGPSEVVRIQHSRPVAWFAEPGAGSQPEVIYAPLKPGCEFQPYQRASWMVGEAAVGRTVTRRLTVMNEEQYAEGWLLWGTRGDRVTIDLRTSGIDASLFVADLFGDRSILGDSATRNGHATMTVTLPRAAPYVIGVAAPLGPTGTYTLHVDRSGADPARIFDERFQTRTWFVGQSVNCTTEYAGGGYRMSLAPPGRGTCRSRTMTHGRDTVRIEAVMRWEQDSALAGIRFGHRGSDYVALTLNRQGVVGFYDHEARFSTTTTYRSGVHPAVRTGAGEENRLTVELVGRRATIYVNGTRISSHTLNYLPPPNVSLDVQRGSVVFQRLSALPFGG